MQEGFKTFSEVILSDPFLKNSQTDDTIIPKNVLEYFSQTFFSESHRGLFKFRNKLYQTTDTIYPNA